MRFSRIIPVVFLLAIAVASAGAVPKEIEIPKAGWAPIFFEDASALLKGVKWAPLREVDVPDGSLEARIWSWRARGSNWHVWKLRRDGDKWTGFYATQGNMSGVPYCRSGEINLRADWPSFWQKVEKLGILTLPDSSTLPEEKLSIRDGGYHVIEINDGSRYRAYWYENPEFHKWPEAKKFLEIARVLQDGLLPPKKE